MNGRELWHFFASGNFAFSFLTSKCFFILYSPYTFIYHHIRIHSYTFCHKNLLYIIHVHTVDYILYSGCCCCCCCFWNQGRLYTTKVYCIVKLHPEQRFKFWDENVVLYFHALEIRQVIYISFLQCSILCYLSFIMIDNVLKQNQNR